MSKGKNGLTFKSFFLIWFGPIMSLGGTGAIYAWGRLWRWLNSIPGTDMEAPNGDEARHLPKPDASLTGKVVGMAAQPDRISVVGVAVTTGGVVAALALILWLAWELMGRWSPRLTQGSPIEPSAAQMPNAHAKEDLHALRAGDDSLLNEYGWEDSAAGKVRIPVAQAMERAVRMGMTLHGDQP